MARADVTIRIDANTSSATRAINNLNRSLNAVKLDSMINLAERAGRAGASIYEVSAAMETLKVRLTTVTGSLDESNNAFDSLNEFATKVPLSVNEVVDAFIKLKTLGLDPSEEAMLSYTNTAAAMGKSLDQMVEAVADAAMGEFERLKEFGIKASKQGDKVTMTFKGVSTTIDNESAKIQQYLLRIGETDFAGAATAQMDTLSGSMSNLGVAMDSLIDTLATTSGFNDLLKEGSQWAAGIAGEMEAALKPSKLTVESLQEQLVVEKELLDSFETKYKLGLLDNQETELRGKHLEKVLRIESQIAGLKAGGTADESGVVTITVPAQEKMAETIDLIAEQFKIEQEMAVAGRQAINALLENENEMSYARQMVALTSFNQSKLIDDKQYAQAKSTLEKEMTDNAIGEVGNALTELGKHNKTAFAMSKAYNIGQAVMNTYTGATKALATYPPPWSFIMAGAQIAMGMAQVASIRSQTYQGKQFGGTVTGNTPYMVGEKGPEMFTPGRTGTITPNNAVGGGTIAVTFNINAVDSNGFDELLQTRKPMIIGMVKQAVHEEPQLLGGQQ